MTVYLRLWDKYSKKYNLKYLKHIINQKKKNYLTNSENIYDLLEPWIQWPTIYTGKKASEHKQFRLGDSVSFDHKTIFNEIENLGNIVKEKVLKKSGINLEWEIIRIGNEIENELDHE